MLTVHRAERSDTLADALGELLAEPLDDPFQPDVVAVAAKGIERWLAQRLANQLGADRRDGVCANIRFPSPARLVDDVLAQSCGIVVEQDPWASSRLVWAVLAAIDRAVQEPWCAVLARHLGVGAEDDHRTGRRYATAMQLTRLFQRYGAERPEMLRQWADGDGGAEDVDADLVWQARLWQLVRSDLAVPSPAERIEAAAAVLRSRPESVDLPGRVSVFGPTRLSADQLAVIGALAARRDVHLWLPHASPAMWSAIPAVRPGPPPRRADHDQTLTVHHPLLAGLGREIRQTQCRLAALDFADVHHPGLERPPTLLGRLQADIRDDRTPAFGESAADSSVEVHACHGAQRQVEVLRERLLHLFQDDPTLEPRDVIVVCPDVENYAPLIRAAFGGGFQGHPGHEIRVRLADRSLHQSNPVLGLVARLLELADARVSANQVLDILASSPVRHRFGFRDDDVERIGEWTKEAGARWGIGRGQRGAFGLADFPQNTFSTALDRVLLGAVAEEGAGQWLSLALPLGDVESNDIDLAGRFAEFIDRLDVSLRGLRGPQTAEEWTSALARALDLLVDLPESKLAWLTQARRELAAALEYGASTQLRLADVRAMLWSRLAGRPGRSNFRTGELTVCTFVPMRAVTHRVVILLGLDDDAFPRVGGVDGDDLLTRDPRVGERDPRDEDRQLLLDALMSATDNLLVFYSGADPVNGSRRPPAVPVAEILDTLSAMTDRPAGSFVTRHPLQPFDPRNFETPDPRSFDRIAFAGAAAAQRARVRALPRSSLLAEPLPQLPSGDVELGELVDFVVHPTKAFLRQRLGIWIPEMDEDIPDELDVGLDGLAGWDLGQRMLEARLAGVSAADFRAAEWRRGTLPPFRLGEAALAPVEHAVETLVAVSAHVHAGRSESIDVDVDLGDGRRLTGTVTDVHGTVIAATTYSRLAPKHRLAAWASVLAVAASEGGDPTRWQAITTGRGFPKPVKRSTLRAQADPVEALRGLVALRDAGLSSPPPIATGTSAVYAERRRQGVAVSAAMEAAEREWGGRFGDCVDRYIEFVHGEGLALSEFAAPGAGAQEASVARLGWSAAEFGEESAFGAQARAMWEPLLSAESVGAP